ncbi:MAG: response regulator, partial [Ferruginibacter sp.]|nr:response regulator [Ferruginibacter sp.]
YLPLKYKETGEYLTASLSKSTAAINILPAIIPSILPKRSNEDVVEDDRAAINYVDKVVLVIEDDIHFSRIMREMAHKAGLKVVVAISYLEIFDCILNYAPIAITLDVTMPETNGWNILKLLKGNKNARHIPVYVISGIDYKDMAYGMGAKSFAVKPLSGIMIETLFQQMITFNNHKLKKVLAITANKNDSIELAGLFNNETIATFYAASGKEAFTELNAAPFDSVVIDYSLPEAMDVLKFMQAEYPGTPVIVYANNQIIKNELQIIKGWHYGVLDKSEGFYGKLLSGVLKALHVNINTLSDEKNNLIEAAMAREDILIGKKVLIVDDDVRNLFALTAAFERCKLEVLTADSGKEAIGIVALETGISMVLMDIMMPDMDGYETIRQIREEEKNKYLPIIAVTAKAMVGDRRKCIEAGASDYITKPIRTDQLLSLMRVWLYNEEMV